MEMAQAKVIALAAAALVICSCGPRFSWEKFSMDGHRTGVLPVDAENVVEALGTVENGAYTAPNGRVFTDGTIVSTAEDMIAVQPRMNALKQVLAYAPRAMANTGRECELTDFLVDHLMEEAGKEFHRKIDVGVLNFGGVRVDIPQGNVLYDDVVSMLPFKNYPVYVALKGEDLLALFEYMGKNRMQIVGGVQVEIENHQLKSLLVGGEPVNPEKIYGVATIDFLLDGGDGLTIGRNAKDLLMSKRILVDYILPVIQGLTAEGKPMEYHTDGRVKFIGEGK